MGDDLRAVSGAVGRKHTHAPLKLEPHGFHALLSQFTHVHAAMAMGDVPSRGDTGRLAVSVDAGRSGLTSPRAEAICTGEIDNERGFGGGSHESTGV